MLVVLGEETEDELSVVGGEVVDHDNLEVGIVLLEKIDEVGAEPLAVVLGGEDHGDGREILGAVVVFFARQASVVADAEIKEAVVEAQNDQTQGGHNGECHGAMVCKNMRKVHFGFCNFSCKNMYYF